jgi:hypothetical protein
LAERLPAKRGPAPEIVRTSGPPVVGIDCAGQEYRFSCQTARDAGGPPPYQRPKTRISRDSTAVIIESSRLVEHQIQLIATAATQQTSAASEISESAEQISQLAVPNSRGA